jgi:hypothetical protein
LIQRSAVAHGGQFVSVQPDLLVQSVIVPNPCLDRVGVRELHPRCGTRRVTVIKTGETPRPAPDAAAAHLLPTDAMAR